MFYGKFRGVPPPPLAESHAALRGTAEQAPTVPPKLNRQKNIFRLSYLQIRSKLGILFTFHSNFLFARKLYNLFATAFSLNPKN